MIAVDANDDGLMVWNVAGDDDDDATGEDNEEDGGEVVFALLAKEALGAALKVLVL